MGKHPKKKGSPARAPSQPEARAPAAEAIPREAPEAVAPAAPLAAPPPPPQGEPGSLLRPDRPTQIFLWFVALVVAGHVIAPDGAFDLLGGLRKKLLGDFTAEEKEAIAAEGPEEPVGGPAPGIPGVGAPVATGDDEPPPLPPPVLPGERKDFTGQAIEDPCVKQEGERCLAYSMDPFYERLAETYRKEPGAVTRIIHFGDSIIASDYISSRARERLLTTFGDSGHGFVFIGQPSRWYYQDDVSHTSSEGWGIRGITGKSVSDGLYGLGGTSFESEGPGAKASFGTVKDKEIGGSVSRFDIYYLEQPGGGPIEISVDGERKETLATAGESKRGLVRSISVEDGPHTLTLKATAAKARVYGVAMERGSPGVVYDSLGLVGGSTKSLLSIDEAHWREQLLARDPGLVILMFGTNEANYTGTSEKAIAEYQATQEALLARLKAALPGAACLLMSPLDSAEEKGGALVTKPVVPKIVEAQRRAAKSAGCAFWDTFSWMGGKGSMAKWYKKGLAASDYAHPSKKGAAKVGDAFFDAILHGYDAYAARKAAPR